MTQDTTKSTPRTSTNVIKERTKKSTLQAFVLGGFATGVLGFLLLSTWLIMRLDWDSLLIFGLAFAIFGFMIAFKAHDELDLGLYSE